MTDYPGFGFEVLARDPDSRARLGRLTTPHGSLETPAFIFCATKAAIKAAGPKELRAANADIILANTYHLMLQPGAELVEKMGGLHKFMGWDGPMLTDSGGFQIFSLGHGSVAGEVKGKRNSKRPPTLERIGIDRAHDQSRESALHVKARADSPGCRIAKGDSDQTGSGLVRITEDGARFRSYTDGAYHTLTPESAVQIQRKLGADLIVVLDECTPFHVDRDYTARSMEMTHRWAARGHAEFARSHDGRQALYGIVQGGVYEDLRRESAEFVASKPFFGHAVGCCLGGDKAEMYGVVGYAMRHLDTGRPVHLLGIGDAPDIWAGVEMGIDTFDCVSPTRVARHGWALSRRAGNNRINLRNARFREDKGPLDDECDCPACETFSRAYIHHLLKAGEMFGIQLLTQHNIAFMTRLMATIRTAIGEGRLAEAKREWEAD